jgi:23S rRNA G2069 N7-methylase RlmK/C1962 C5-methylase RlmI
VEDGGLFVTCSCSGRLPAEDFEAIAHASAADAGKWLEVSGLSRWLE